MQKIIDSIGALTTTKSPQTHYGISMAPIRSSMDIIINIQLIFVWLCDSKNRGYS